MELTKEQIQRVEHYLNVKNIKYADVRFEVLDHIITDVETTIEKKNIDFETAFYKVTDKWNTHLKETSSWYFGVGFLAPKIIIKKAKKIYGNYYLLLLVSYFLPFIVLTKLDFTIQNPTESNFYILIQAFVVFVFVTFLYMFLKKSNKVKTTYSFILNALSLNTFMGLIVSIWFLNSPKELDGINIGMCFAFIFSAYSYYVFFKKHQKAIKKYKSV
ncbi:hypothetical protein JL193_10160 [Polaribacter batillariae]|uniref:DUF1129 domain-containing protein n=1 Tax=Polaribacter batillariae TaxID=2808900 RepID=A0ABX7SU68_9FLAO|nr:hypothetical protein [Polaribacter batillariae]QTD36511.1 hypothetical protein JL193_10160 [Polaribacter batillariae]